MTRPLRNPAEVYRCQCGWTYESPVRLSEPPAHRCKPNIPRTRTLRKVAP